MGQQRRYADSEFWTKRAKTIIGLVLIAILAIGLVAGILWDRQRKNDMAAEAANAPQPSLDLDAINAEQAPPTLTIPADPKVLFIGDSFTEGHGSDDKKTRGFAPRLASIEGWTNYRVDGIGLTGFIRPGSEEDSHRTLGERLQRLYDSKEYTPNLIVFQAGLNDSPYDAGQIKSGTEATLTLTKQLWPDAQIVVIGPISYRTSLNKVNTAYKAAAYDTEVPYVDLNTRPVITQDQKDQLLIADGWHPNDAGHQLLAEALFERFNELAPQDGS
jgi:lysophospholipase L1-like esterase